jgi:hypothetical protein
MVENEDMTQEEQEPEKLPEIEDTKRLKKIIFYWGC